jgi:hypothetical protein
VADPCKAHVCGHSIARIVSSSTAESMDVRILCFVLCRKRPL